MAKYKIADVIFDIDFRFNYAEKLCSAFLYDGQEPAVLKITTTDENIAEEREAFDVKNAPDYYLESFSVERKISEYILDKADGVLFHGSAICYQNKAYIFTAKSGTGKSTHARLWREMLKDEVYMINDDKPIIRVVDDIPYVYGTPWMGKHNLGENVKVEIKAVCKIYQNKENVIKRATVSELIPTFMVQSYVPKGGDGMVKFLTVLDKMLKKVELFELGCNISEEAAKTSFNAMVKGEGV